MLTIKLQAQTESLWKGEANPAPLTFPHGLLYHQWRTYNAGEPIIINSMNTGMGKTKAALLRMLKRAQRSDGLDPTTDNVLLIAPTNELIMQHVEDARQFCQENELPYRVNPLTREMLDQFIAMQKAEHHHSQSTRTAYDLLTFLRDSSQLDKDYTKTVDLWVVNPDIFHYAITFGYNQFDRSQLFNEFFGRFNYIIVDEFHYYDAKQLATFLFFIKYSQYQGYIGSSATQRQFCILTATPRQEVKEYLRGLGEQIAWIEPGDVAPQDQQLVEPVCVLAPVSLQIFSTEELQSQEQSGGLLQLVTLERRTFLQEVGQLRDGEPVEGAIISSSKGMISLIRQALLHGGIDPQRIGCITGAETRASRNLAKTRALILATPTVDLGYNFERSYRKNRQNIDVLFFDAGFRDELFQRLGRAARVLGKKVQDQESMVYAIVPPDCYELLRPFDQTTLERKQFHEILNNEAFPDKNEMSAYLRSRAIIGLYSALVELNQGMSDSQQETFLDSFLVSLYSLFAGKEVTSQQVPTLKSMRGMVFRYREQMKCYGGLKHIDPQAFELFPNVLKKKIGVEDAEKAYPGVGKPLEAFCQRLRDVQKRFLSRDLSEACEWFQKDIQEYAIEKVRSSFREGFQPPLALVYDPGKLHSNTYVTTYNALHFVRYYHLQTYDSLDDWQRQTKQEASARENAEAVAYFLLRGLREKPLQLKLKLEKRDKTRSDWEERNTCQLTALHGLRIVASKDNHGLSHDIQALFEQQLIVAFVARNQPSSATQREIWKVQKKARLYPMVLTLDFKDMRAQEYLAVLGTMAFHACAEVPYCARARDLGKAQQEDEAPFIC